MVGMLHFPLVAIVLSFTVDAASTNLSVILEAMEFYAQYNNANWNEALVFVAVVLCLAHQIHISSRSGMAALDCRDVASRGMCAMLKINYT